MSKKGELGVASLLAYQHAHHLLFMKSKIMKHAMDDFSWMPEHEDIDAESYKEVELLTKELIRLELIANTVHYAEVFAASLLAMKKFKQFHKFLLEYKPREIIEFYKETPMMKIEYVNDLLQYPELSKIQSSDVKDELIKSVNEMHKEINNIARFYLDWHEVYNAYKHGLRIAAGQPNPSEDFTFLAYPFSAERLDQMKIHSTDKEIEKCLRFCSFMWNLLNNVESNFQRFVLEKKNDPHYDLTIFHPVD
jgi:hypothetical protein